MPDLFGSSAPVISVDGERQAALARDLLQLEVLEDTTGMKRLVVCFSAWGAVPGQADENELYFDGRLLDFGKRIEVSLGPADRARTVFKGLISAIEADYAECREPHVRVFAEDTLMKLRLKHRSKTWEDSSDADIVRSIAAEHGLQAEVAAAGPTHTVVQQFNQSDLAFLRERARLLQAEIWLEGDTLHFSTRAQRSATALTLVAGNQLLKLQARADLAHQRSAVHVTGYDVQDRDRIDRNAGADAVRAEAGGGRIGAELLGRALGEYPSHRVRELPLDDAAASAWAQAELLRRARGFVRITGLTNGSPDMVVGSSLTLERVAAPFAGGRYRVTQTTQQYDLQHGHRTAFEAERPHLETA